MYHGQNQDKLCRVLLQYRNTPSHKDRISPAQKLYGHPVQDSLPAHHHSFSPHWQCKTAEVKKQLADTLEDSTQYYNAHVHPLPDIHIGSSVAVQNPQTKLVPTGDTTSKHMVDAFWLKLALPASMSTTSFCP